MSNNTDKRLTDARYWARWYVDQTYRPGPVNKYLKEVVDQCEDTGAVAAVLRACKVIAPTHDLRRVSNPRRRKPKT